MRRVALFLGVLIQMAAGPVLAGGTEPDTTPPEHWQAVAACDIKNKELCGWWRTDPSECCDRLVYGTRWVADSGTADCKVLREGRDDVQIYSVFRCRWTYTAWDPPRYRNAVIMLAIRSWHFDGSFDVMRDFSLSQSESPVTDELIDCLIERGRIFAVTGDYERKAKCSVNWGRFSRGAELTPRTER